MLDLSRIDSGELHLRLARFDLTATIFSALLSFEKTPRQSRGAEKIFLQRERAQNATFSAM